MEVSIKITTQGNGLLIIPRNEVWIALMVSVSIFHLTVNPIPNKNWFLRVCSTNLSKTLAKGAISPFPAVFSTLMENFLLSPPNLKLSSANSFSLRESKICCSGKGLTYVHFKRKKCKTCPD